MNLTQRLRPAYYEPIEEQLKRIFFEIIFQPIMGALADVFSPALKELKELRNAPETLIIQAIDAGRIQYHEGIFTGKFSAAISASLRAMGASFDSRRGIYRLDVGKVPGSVKAAAANFISKARAAHEEVLSTLGFIEDSLDEAVDKSHLDAFKALGRMERDFTTISKKLEVSPTLTEGSKQRLAKDYTENMKLWIKKFSEESIMDLREAVETNAQQGYRFDKLVDAIQLRHGVAQTKAKFLARQETGLYMSKFRRERFAEAGVERYVWQTSHDERVRSSHRHLDKKEFFYDDPPIVDTATGRRGNPGEDFNCRCVDRPILKGLKEAA